MKNRFIFFNPKALNLEAIRDSNKRVTLGVKCSPSLKISLATDAKSRGLTLSKYVEYLLISNDNKQLLITLSELTEKVNYYESDTLKELFEAHKFQTVKFINRNGETVNLKINSIRDIYFIIINSFQISPNA